MRNVRSHAVVRQFIWSLILQIIWSKICLFFILNYDDSHYLISVSSHWRYQKSSNCLNASVHSFWFFFLQIIRMQNHHIYSMLLFTVVELIFFTLSALKIIKLFARFCAVLEIVFSSIYLLFFLSECVHRVIHISRSGYKKPRQGRGL